MGDCQISTVLIPSGILDAFWTAEETSFRGKALDPGTVFLGVVFAGALGLAGHGEVVVVPLLATQTTGCWIAASPALFAPVL